MPRFAVLLLVPLLAALAAASGAGAQTGRLAYVKDNAAYVGPADGYAPAVRLPGSQNAVEVSLSPADGVALFFVAPAKPTMHDPVQAKGAACRPPYREAKWLGAPLSDMSNPRVIWSANGDAAFASDAADTVHGRYTPADGRAVNYPIPVDSVSADGAVVAYARENREVRVRFRATGREKVLFSSGRPQALFEAVRRAKHPKGIASFREGMGGEMSRDARNWAIGTPAITPDGKTVFFATNGGGGMGASGNCTFAFFSVDVATGNIAILSKVGEEFGRVPYRDCRVSPDGRRLLYVASAHSSAVENPSWVTVIDLPTQQTRVVSRGDTANDAETNAFGGACWSPDGKYVAYSMLYYDVAAAMKRLQEGGAWEYDPAKYTLFIRDAATGRAVRKIPGATSPSWGK
ncbi:MAG TPA: hypothetical protein VM490_12460 [Armatimonadaceae bacterium]|nr:hypothetical protein [Armatimonadaceae bacterium]